MYGYFKGIIQDISASLMIIEVNNIGYNILMPMAKSYTLGSVGDEVKVYTYTYVREDAINLFGFVNKDELELFKLLISVSGVGPKSGQEILNAFSYQELVNAIANKDAKTIAKAPGVGKKTAERVIIDLSDKVKSLAVTAISTTDNQDQIININGDLDNLLTNKEAIEAIEALVSLGYSSKDSKNAVNELIKKSIEAGASEGLTSEQLLKGALKIL